jgi:hypothetical protein
MAQNLLHRRSLIAGKVPDTGSLLVGELGINVYDGKVYLHKSGSSESIETLVSTNSITTGSITLTGTGSFGELNITNDINVGGDAYISGDIVGNGDLDIQGAVSASIVSASFLVGDGRYISGVTASMRPDDYDFNSDPFAGTIGYIQASGSLYKVATTQDAVEFRYNDTAFATFTTGSTQLYGIGDIMAFSASVAAQFAMIDAGSF